VDRFVAAGRPAGAALDEIGVRNFTDHKVAGKNVGTLNLQVALEAKIVVALDEELAIDRAVRAMASGAAFAEGFVFVNEGAALFAMALRALFVEAGHGEAAGGLHRVVAVRVVALHTIHVAFDDRMMLRKIEFGMDVDVALETGARIFAGVDDETTATAADADVFAGRAMAGFAAADAREFYVVLVETAVRAEGECLRDVGVTFHAGSVADKMRAGDVRRGDDGAFHGRAGQQQNEKSDTATDPQKISVHLHLIALGMAGCLPGEFGFWKRKMARATFCASD
jgi:hypothetical protein